MAEIKNINDLLSITLNIPDYQRPYKWDIQNITDLLMDIENAIGDANKYKNGFRYRIGTIILHVNDGKYDIVDGQQRIISLVLLKKYFKSDFVCSIFEQNFTNKTTQYNIHQNYTFIKEYFSLKSSDIKEAFVHALEYILEVVVIYVDKVAEAFQFFDSQNTRGKTLDPHDLLKAYHLREMKDNPYEMEYAVTKWEAKDTTKIKELFDLYLFPIWNWSKGNKSKPFTSKYIDVYKGVSASSTYSYAKRANKTAPCFQITEAFITGNDFFEMVEHYMRILRDVKFEIYSNPNFKEIKTVLCNGKDVNSPEDMDKIKFDSTGFRYTKNLFYCALLCYYDRFNNFDVMVVKKLFIWAFMLRIDMQNLGFDSINKYAIGDQNPNYTNSIGVFSKICFARKHYEISSLQLKINIKKEEPSNPKWVYLHNVIKNINGYGEHNE